MVFCAYCGKSFTRKEHLERHIPSHTNVKPHRCSACQLSFSRRDLLQRHHATYHEARDPVPPLAGGAPGSGPGCGAVPTVAGRTPIACQNCANAKTGCDKRVPCARCAEKSLPCAARFARRSSKAAVRGGSGGGSGGSGTVGTTGGPAAGTAPPVPLTPTYADFAQCPLPPPSSYYHHHHHHQAPALTFADACGLPPHDPAAGPYDLYLADAVAAGHEHGLQQPLPVDMDGVSWAAATAAQYHGADDDAFAAAAAAGLGDRGAYADLVWADYPMLDLAMDATDPLDHTDAAAGLVVDDCMHQLYANPLHLGLNALAPAPTAPMAPEPFLAPPPPPSLLAPCEPSDVSPHSEPMTASSSSWASSPMHTRGTSILSWSGSAGASAGTSAGSGSCGSGEYGGYSEALGLFLPPQALLDRAARAATTTGTATAEDGSEDGSAVSVDNARGADEAADAADAAWPLARCMPMAAAGVRPHAVGDAVERLHQQLLQGPRATDPAATRAADPCDPPVVPLTARAHAALLAVLDGALHRALAVHGRPARPCCGDADADPDRRPTAAVLDALLRSGVRRLARHTCDALPAVVDPNALLLDDGTAAAQSLVLLLLAHGAAADDADDEDDDDDDDNNDDAPLSAAGLAEVGRLALADAVAAEGTRRADATVLRCEWLRTQLGAWSGDAGLMEAALAARSTVLPMLQHAGLLEPPPPLAPVASLGPHSTEHQWQAWRQSEAQNRLVYSWVLVDQELSLFYDAAPALGVDAIRCPLPGADALWRAPSASHWSSAMDAVEDDNNDVDGASPSLRALFRAFLCAPDALARRRPALSPQQLRLLLYPLQCLVGQLVQVLLCFSGEDEDNEDEDEDVPDANDRATPSALARASVLQQLDEAQALLHRWSVLAEASRVTDDDNDNDEDDNAAGCARVLYHLVALNAVADVPAIERLARRGPSLVPCRRRLFRAPRQTVVGHCGQALRLLRRMPAAARPGWWSVAVYRAVLVLWADCVCGGTEDRDEREDTGRGVDRDGMPATPAGVLRAGAQRLGEASETRLGHGIRRTLLALRRRWEAGAPGGGPYE